MEQASWPDWMQAIAVLATLSVSVFVLFRERSEKESQRKRAGQEALRQQAECIAWWVTFESVDNPRPFENDHRLCLHLLNQSSLPVYEVSAYLTPSYFDQEPYSPIGVVPPGRMDVDLRTMYPQEYPEFESSGKEESDIESDYVNWCSWFMPKLVRDNVLIGCVRFIDSTGVGWRRNRDGSLTCDADPALA